MSVSSSIENHTYRLTSDEELVISSIRISDVFEICLSKVSSLVVVKNKEVLKIATLGSMNMFRKSDLWILEKTDALDLISEENERK